MIPDQIKLAAAALAISLSAYASWSVQGYRLDAANARYNLLVTQIESVGKIAQAEADAKIAADKSRRGKADAENKITTDRLRADIEWMRKERAGQSLVPAAPAGSSSPDRACFDRGELEQAIQSLDSEVSGIVDKGSKATIDLNTAKRWAQQ